MTASTDKSRGQQQQHSSSNNNNNNNTHNQSPRNHHHHHSSSNSTTTTNTTTTPSHNNHSHGSGSSSSNSSSAASHNGKHRDGKSWGTKPTNVLPHRKCSRHGHTRTKTESVLSTDSDIRFTRRKLGDSQRCGCAVIVGFLLTLLLASIAIYLGYTFFRPEPLPERVFRAKLRVIKGDSWSPELADQNSMRFQHKQRDYRERINLVVRRSDLRDSYEGSEVLALDGIDGEPDLTVHVNLHFDPYRALVSAADLTAIFLDEINAPTARHFANITLDPASLQIVEVIGDQGDGPATGAAPLGGDSVTSAEQTTPQTVRPPSPPPPPRKCQPLRLPYCKSIGYNVTVYPNHLDHENLAEVNADLIAFRELVDSECFRQAFDFVCRLLQPPCVEHTPLEPVAQPICREYCQSFWLGCGSRLPERFRKYFDCERFPESTGAQSCHSRPGCAADMQANAQSNRLCDGIADCPDLSDEVTCSYCAVDSMYCGRGRACFPRSSRCDGKLDCADGSDEKDCLSIAPQVSFLTNPPSLSPHRSRFYSEGFAVFLEKGETGKLCSEGLDGKREAPIRQTVAESLCKALGYEKLEYSEVRNDSEPNTNYVRVLDPRAEEISFVRTSCANKQALYVSCGNLDCGISSSNLPKMAAPGDWPWHVALFRDDTHVCDGTLVSADWVLTTESCFQGQPKATWIAVFGSIRLNAQAPWTQRRRIVGMVKSPVEGSTAALIRLETSVAFSNFIRPICLSDQISTPKLLTASTTSNRPHSEQLVKRSPSSNSAPSVDRKYFIAPMAFDRSLASGEYNADFSDEQAINPRAEAVHQQSSLHTNHNYPAQVANYYETKQVAPPHVVQQFQQQQHNLAATSTTLAPPTPEQQWSNCNTLGWSRQREHLQRVQLKIGKMSACENVSIATVNSMCAETAYHAQDCSEEEFAGSPVMCMLPDGNQWALVAIASWRIVCAQSGIERPRMYDKITSNTAWIRDTMNSD